MTMKVKSRSIAFATIIALALASISAASVFAAPTKASNSVNNDPERVWGSQFRELQTDRTIYNNIRSHSEQLKTSSKPARIQQYLDQYTFALKQAEAIIIHGSPSSTSTVQVNNRYEKSLTAQQQLAMYLHMMRGLQDKLAGT